VPFFTLWHEPHVPSAGSSAFSSAVPETVLPDCVSTHVTRSPLNESAPVPVHLPASVNAAAGDAVGEGAGPAGDEVEGAGTLDWHAATHAASTAIEASVIRAGLTTCSIDPVN
jgi:hypothetical protein